MLDPTAIKVCMNACKTSNEFDFADDETICMSNKESIDDSTLATADLTSDEEITIDEE